MEPSVSGLASFVGAGDSVELSCALDLASGFGAGATSGLFVSPCASGWVSVVGAGVAGDSVELSCTWDLASGVGSGATSG
ncbi:hypothetical protein [Coleofasciculus sp.]|uniref:hypothetical protein n=1 Tax=Coleofasciculus sp. TaxID=3100458 RepID=UPI003A26F68D